MNKLFSKLIKLLKSERGGVSYTPKDNIPKELIDRYEIKDLVDLKKLKKLFDEFTRATGFTIGFLDHPDLNILIQSNWRRICTDFHRKCPASLKNCLKSNHKLLDKLNKPGQVFIEECENGMVDCATPITIAGKHVASLATGQMLLKEPDIEKFKKQAKLFGYNEKEYIKALKEVRVIKKDELITTTKFLGDLAIIISEMGYERLQDLKEKEDLKKAQEELRQSELKFKTLFNNANEGIILADKKTKKINFVNPAICKMLGYFDKDLIGKSINILHPKAEIQKVLKAFNDLAKGKIKIAENIPLLKKNKKVFYCEVSAKPLLINKTHYLLGFFRDTTDKLIAEKKLRENESLLNETSKIARVGGWEFDVKNLNLKWSKEVFKIHEVDESSFKPTVKKAINFYAPSSRPIIEKAVNEAIKNKKPFDVELEIITNKGNHRWVHALGKFIPYKNNNGNGKISGTFQDITERKKVQEALIVAEEKYRSTISAMDDLIFVLDKNGAFIYYHAPDDSLLYLNPKSFIGKSVSAVMPPVFLKSFDESFQKNKKGQVYAFDYALEMKGEMRHFNAKFSPIMDGKTFKGSVAVVRDITHRIKTEEDLRKSKLLAEKYLQIAGVIMVALDSEGKITLLNEKGCDLLGYKENELIGKNWFDLVVPEIQRAEVKKVFRKIISGEIKQAESYENPVIAKNGAIRDVHWHNALLKDDYGKIIGTLSSGEDITEKKKIEEELKIKDIVFKESQASNSIADKNGILKQVNSTFLKLVGCSHEKEVVGRPVLDFFKNVEDGNKLLEILTKKGEWRGEINVKRKDDGFLLAYGSATTIKNEKGEVIGYQSSMYDITDRKNAERKLKESEEKYHSVVENAKDGILIIQDMIIKYGNSALAKMRGEPIKNIINTRFDTYIQPEELQKVKEYYIRRMEGKEVPSNYETALIKKDGKKINVELNASIIQYESKPADLVIVRNVTERKKIEEELKTSKAQIENISNNLEGGMIYQAVMLKDGTRKITYVSDKVRQFYGVSPEQALKDSSLIYKKIHPGDAKRLMETEEKANQTFSVFRCEARVFNPDGSIRFSYFISVPKKLPDGTTSWDGIELDITERKAMEEELKKSRNRLQEEVKKRTAFLDSILENIPDMIFVKEAKDLKFELFNKAGEDLLGYKRKDLLGKNDYDFFPLKEADFFINKDRLTLKNKALVDIPEETISTKAGPRYLHTKKIPILDENGEPKYLLGISEDITERKKLQDELTDYTKGLEKKVAERTRDIELNMAKDKAILESIGEGLVVFSDIAENKGKIIYVNKAFEEITGWKPEEVVNNDSFTLKMSDSEETTSPLLNKDVYRKILKGEKITTGINRPYYYFNKDGAKFPVASIITPIILEDKIIGLVDVFKDVTKELQVDRAKTEFVSLASHQLRTPLSVIKWYTEALLSKNPIKSLNREKYLQEVYHGNERMIKLVNNLLNVARLEMGKLKINSEVVNPVKLLQEVVETQKIKIFEKNQSITIEPENVPDTYVDIELLKMVFANIIFNAIKYTPEKGKIECKVKQDKSNILFEISDNGIGIPESEQGKIFEKLYRASNALTVDREGAGLGLYLVKEIMKILGGSIKFKSKPGEGTTFYIEIPIKNKL